MSPIVLSPLMRDDRPQMKLGCDVDLLENIAREIDRAAMLIEGDVLSLATGLEGSAWRGQDRESTVARVRQELLPLSRAAASSLRGAADELSAQALAQRAHSGGHGTAWPRVAMLGRPADERELSRRVLTLDDAAGLGVVAIGDIGSAERIVVLVPGLGTDLHDLPRLADDAEAIVRATDRRAGDSGTAAIAWLGYDAPGGHGIWRTLAEVLTTVRARSGARSLVTFVESLRRTHDASVVLVGHSYGSLVVAHAARRTPDVDVIVAGSPGLGVNHVRELDLATGVRLFAVAEPADLVASSGWFGRDPSEAGFGAHVIEARPRSGAESPGVLDAHSYYFEEHSGTLDAIAEVIAGARVTRTR